MTEIAELERDGLKMKRRPEFETIDVSHQFIDLAERRTAFLFYVMQFGSQTIKTILASAYLQGVSDGAEAIENRAKRQAAPTPEPPTHHC